MISCEKLRKRYRASTLFVLILEHQYNRPIAEALPHVIMQYTS